jgi:hypothetical protein
MVRKYFRTNSVLYLKGFALCNPAYGSLPTGCPCRLSLFLR